MSGGGNTNEGLTIIEWVIVLGILCFIVLLMVQLMIRKRRRQKKEINKIIDDEQGTVNNTNERSVSDGGYDRIESEERRMDIGIVDTITMTNDDRRFVSAQEITANTPQTALLNNTVSN